MDNLRLAIINHIEDLKAELEREKLLVMTAFLIGRRDIIRREINTLLGLLEETA